MKTQLLSKTFVLTGVLLAAGVEPAAAHVCNIVLSKPAVTSTCGDPDEGEPVAEFTPTVGPDGTITLTDDAYTPFGWLAGAQPTLGDTHAIDDGKFYVFTLRRWSSVTIKFANSSDNASPFDTAFSLYRGVLPAEAHDDAAFDPLNPVDDVNFLPIASPTDSAPAKHEYVPLDRFRDTKLYSQTGGLDASGNPVHPFVGQFNAINDFSMANEEAVPGEAPGENWTIIRHVAHENRRGAGQTESLTLALPPGDYTIAAGGANCAAPGAAGCGSSSFYSATIGLKVKPL